MKKHKQTTWEDRACAWVMHNNPIRAQLAHLPPLVGDGNWETVVSQGLPETVGDGEETPPAVDPSHAGFLPAWAWGLLAIALGFIAGCAAAPLLN